MSTASCICRQLISNPFTFIWRDKLFHSQFSAEFWSPLRRFLSRLSENHNFLQLENLLVLKSDDDQKNNAGDELWGDLKHVCFTPVAEEGREKKRGVKVRTAAI